MVTLMVIQPDPDWSEHWLSEIARIERVLTVKKNSDDNYDICGLKTAKGTPCQRPPYIARGVTNGRCKLHANIPNLPITKKGIFNKKVSFMRCNICDVGQGRCDRHEAGKDCIIESEWYDTLWKELDAMFPMKSLRVNLLCKLLVDDYVRILRCQRYEKFLSTSIFVSDKIADLEDKIVKRVLGYMKELDLKKTQIEKSKSLFGRVGL